MILLFSFIVHPVEKEAWLGIFMMHISQIHHSHSQSINFQGELEDFTHFSLLLYILYKYLSINVMN